MKKAVLVGLVAATATLGACDKLQSLFKVGSPPRKPGLWEQSVVSDRNPTPVLSKWCFDAASDRRLPVIPKGPRRAGSCSQFNVAKNGDAYTVDSVCGFGAQGGPSITSHVVISGDYSSKYTMVSTTDIEGAPDATRNGKHTTTITMTYQGADCPSELGPGQMERPDGTVVDMAQLRGGGFGGGGGGGGRDRSNSTEGGNATNAASNAATNSAAH
jgi:hypothetical protein